jgi:hypothetical protein
MPACTLSLMHPDIPDGLKARPFFVAEAGRMGLDWRDLQTRSWSRLSRGQSVWSGISNDTALTLRAVAVRMPALHAFSGPTAAWLLGMDMPPCTPVEVTVARDVPVRARAGIRLRRASLAETDVITRRGFRTTSALRTACDLGSRRDIVESVVALDSALHAGLVKLSELQSHVATHAGAKGIRRLRRATRLADAAIRISDGDAAQAATRDSPD